MFRQITEILTLIVSATVQFLFYSNRIPQDFIPKRILVIKLDHIGDVLLSTPVFSNLKKTYPDSDIHALTGKWSQVILENNPNVTQVLEYNSPTFTRTGRPTSLSNTIRLYKFLRHQKYDLLIHLRGDWRTVWFSLFRLTPIRLCRPYYQITNKLGFNKFSSTHETTRNLDVLNKAGIQTPITDTSFSITKENSNWTIQFLTEHEIDREIPIIAIHPGSPIAIKRWEPQNFAELGDWLINNTGGQILFVGVKDENQIIQKIQELMNRDSHNIAGLTTIPQLASVLQQSKLFIGNDSGPMHLAAAVGIQTIGLFGPGNPNRFAPVGDNCHYIWKKQDCRPCRGDVCQLGSEGCMVKITVQNVIETINTKCTSVFYGRKC